MMKASLMTMMTKSYNELKHLNTFEERLEYLQLSGTVAYETFGFDRYINQALYSSKEWRTIRNEVIARDNGCDLGIEGYELNDKILIHHINPITKEDINNRNPIIFDLNNLISCSHKTHNAIHYGTKESIKSPVIERHPGDTKLW